jgi:hypothetical protein
MKRPLNLLAIVLIHMLVSSAMAKDIPEFRARVKVDVIADENLKGVMKRHVASQFEVLKDVELVDYEPEWKLQLQATNFFSKSGDESGIVLSVVILNRFMNHRIPAFIQVNDRRRSDKGGDEPYYYADNWLKVGSERELERLCGEIVCEFNEIYIEENRKNHRQLLYMIKKTMQSVDIRP